MMKKTHEEAISIEWLASTHYHLGFTYYVTFRSKPTINNRDCLESMISMFCQRLDRKVLGRNYYKSQYQLRRTDAVVVYQDQDKYDLHAHALIKLPTVGRNVWKDKTAAAYVNCRAINQMHLCWNGKHRDQKAFHSIKDLRDCINPYGCIDVQFLFSENDTFKALDYSLRKTSIEQQEWKFLAEHARNKHPNMNTFGKKLEKLKKKLKWSCHSGHSFREEFPKQRQKLFDEFPVTFKDRYVKKSGIVKTFLERTTDLPQPLLRSINHENIPTKHLREKQNEKFKQKSGNSNQKHEEADSD